MAMAIAGALEDVKREMRGASPVAWRSCFAELSEHIETEVRKHLAKPTAKSEDRLLALSKEFRILVEMGDCSKSFIDPILGMSAFRVFFHLALCRPYYEYPRAPR